ncbi:MAG: translation initiation factor IF-2 [Deltaproteobacteria bacterium RIFCSPLOWO2_02_FULL_44_10]|nr:MAG: translation initiation factor IF-2 [Deltaproteobacteria bacterium RIFCSPHIGHO2_02_FULL_44_16]OGQ45894.1 MAG: translation initiation factor IF-2 [Deltaproteobacteria bacterium RIFCSPLOWO2_02_FULL_44_10]
MTTNSEKETHDVKTEVVEKRLKPTLIRRRASALPPPSEAEQSAETTSVPKQEQTVVSSASALSSPEQRATTTPSSTPAKTGEPKIGLVGHINLVSTDATREDWKEKLQRGPKRRRSRDELEMENILRAGGLKQYATINVVEEDPSSEVVEEAVVVPEEVVETAPSVERVFQPIARRKKSTRKGFKKTEITEPKAIKKVIRIAEAMSVSELSQATGKKVSELMKRLVDLGIMVTVNQRIEFEVASMIAEELGYKIEQTALKEEDLLTLPLEKILQENIKPRAPVVTVMGHVDHGKTSLLDAIRKTNVVEGEAGGITQHIGAYEVSIPKGKLTFLDTPGHEAFTSMRARGAKVTDIVVLVVAADDGIMPQTVEAIHHAKAAEVPIIVAINKIDKPGAQPERVKQALTEHELVPEEWGGDVICIPTSAKTKEGVEKLLEMILLQAEVLELKADPTIRPKGVVVEARLDKGRGPVATLIVQEGTLRVGDFIVCGFAYGKIRAMTDATGKVMKEALPSQPVEIQGLSSVPDAGDEFVGVLGEKEARQIIDVREVKERKKSSGDLSTTSLEDLQRELAAGETKELVLVIKADVHGSAEAVADSLLKLQTDIVKVKVLHKGVGGITENDVMLASASNAIVLGFNVKPDSKAKAAAERERVEIRSYRIIYEMIDDIRKAMEGLLAPEESEKSLGTIEVREVFKITKVGQIAGCYVTSGKITRNALVRLLRDQVVVYEGKISSLKRFKDDAREVTEGYECGIGIENFNDIKVGDIIEAYVIEKKAASL